MRSLCYRLPRRRRRLNPLGPTCSCRSKRCNSVRPCDLCRGPDPHRLLHQRREDISEQQLAVQGDLVDDHGGPFDSVWLPWAELAGLFRRPPQIQLHLRDVVELLLLLDRFLPLCRPQHPTLRQLLPLQ